MRKNILSALIIALTLLLALTLSTKVSAGASKNYIISESSVKNSLINQGDFIENNVSAKDSTLIFDGSGNVKTTGYVRNLQEYGLKSVLDACIGLNIKSLSPDSMFSIIFGVQSLRGDGRKEGSVELRFTSIGNSILAEVISYNTNGEIKNVKEKLSLDETTFDTELKVKLNYSTSRDLSLTISKGNTVLFDIDNKKIPMISGEGYFMMDLTGNGMVETKNMSVYCYNYEVAENPDYLETFDNGMYNTNLFYSNSLLSPHSPSYLQVSKKDSNGYLEFMNTAAAHITTLYEYSNFEMSFDLIDLARTVRRNEDGTISQYISQWFGIAFGVDSPRSAVDIRGCNWFQFDGMKDYISSLIVDDTPRYIAWENGVARKVVGQKDTSLYLYDPILEGKIVKIRIEVIDGCMKVFMGLKEETEPDLVNNPVFEYDYGTTRTGYVRIMTWGDSNIDKKGIEYNGFGNFSIDNLEIKNLDYDGVKKSITVKEEYKTIGNTDDFDYINHEVESDTLKNKIKGGSYSFSFVKEGKGCKNSFSLVSIIAPVCVIAITYYRKKEEEDEK